MRINARMERIETPFTALQRAIEIAGSQAELARRCETYQPRVNRWLSANRVQPEFVLAVERATGVSRHDLRPDIYPRPLRRASDRQLAEYGDADDGNQTDILDFTQGATL